MKKLLLGTALSTALLLAACGGEMEEPEATEESDTSTAAEPAGEETESTETEDTEEVVEEETETVDENLSVGESVEIDGVTFTLNSTTYTDERNEFAEIVPDSVIVLDMTYENGTGADITVGGDVSVYADGTKAESYPIMDFLMDTISDGRNITGKEGFAIMGEPSEIEVEFSPLMSFSGEKAVFTVTPE